ncbi:MAG: hypothetical protein RLP44_27030 [Aggregatilineales bacterium]
MRLARYAVVLFVITVVFCAIDAQIIDEIRDTPFSASPNYATWLSNSEWFTYIDPTLEIDGLEGLTTWVAYSPSTSRYIVGDQWFPQTALSPEEASLINTTDIVRASPDNSLLVFSSRINDDPVPPGFTFQLFRRSDNVLIDTGIQSFGATTTRQPVNVIWSERNNALSLFVTDSFGLVHIYYFPDASSMNPYWIEFDGLICNDTEYAPFESYRHSLFDISEDGGKLLLTVEELSTVYPNLNYLVIWKPEQPENSHMITTFDGDSVLASAFSPDDSGNVLVVLDDGSINLYDPNTGHVETLATLNLPPMTPDNPGAPQFSPNGEWLAFFSIRDRVAELDFVDISALLSDRN